jgi:hypothetical protein
VLDGAYKRPVDCNVIGETVGDNPTHCTVFTKDSWRNSYEIDDPKPCCVTATPNSKLPDHLKGIAEVDVRTGGL